MSVNNHDISSRWQTSQLCLWKAESSNKNSISRWTDEQWRDSDNVRRLEITRKSYRTRPWASFDDAKNFEHHVYTTTRRLFRSFSKNSSDLTQVQPLEHAKKSRDLMFDDDCKLLSAAHYLCTQSKAFEILTTSLLLSVLEQREKYFASRGSALKTSHCHWWIRPDSEKQKTHDSQLYQTAITSFPDNACAVVNFFFFLRDTLAPAADPRSGQGISWAWGLLQLRTYTKEIPNLNLRLHATQNEWPEVGWTSYPLQKQAPKCLHWRGIFFFS